MDLNFTDKQNAFREEVRAFLKEKLPPDIAAKSKQGKTLAKEDFYRWNKRPFVTIE